MVVHGGDNARLLGMPPLVKLVCHRLPVSGPPFVAWANVTSVALHLTLGFQDG